jgi:ketosteroid isomerase-like protein
MILNTPNRPLQQSQEHEMHFKSLAASFALIAMLPACAVNLNVNDTQLLGVSEAEEEAMILSVLTAQQDAWNAGDIDGFMAGYWQSPDLRFASGGTMTRGWQETSDRYNKNYADRAAMGRLTFSDLEVSRIGDDDAVVHGGWALARAADNPSGLFTLLLRKIDGTWKVVSDTTTSAN